MNGDTPRIAKRGREAPASPIRRLIPFSDTAKKKGIKVYHLNIGDPDFEVPTTIAKTLQKIAKKFVSLPYSNSKGDKDMIASWVKYYQDIGIKLTQENVVVTSGGSEGLILTAAVIFDPGDEYLVFEPFYANYKGFSNLVSAKITAVPLSKTNGYHLPSDQDIVRSITRKTKAIFFTNPNNPTGTVFSKQEVQRVLDIAKKYNLWIVSDETYFGMTFNGQKSVSMLHLAKGKDKDRVIIVDSLSKKLNVCGARIGAVISTNLEVMDAIYRSAQARLSVATLEQQMVTPMLSNCLPYVKQIAKKYEKRRDVFLSTLEKTLGIKIHWPEGAFYTIIKLPVKNTEEFAKWLLTDFSDKKETVMVAPAGGFYVTPRKGLDEIRVAYVLNEKALKRAAELLGLAVKKYLQKSSK